MRKTKAELKTERKVRALQELEDNKLAIFESIEHIAKFRERLLNLGIAMNDSIAEQNLEYRTWLNQIRVSIHQIEAIEDNLPYL